MSNPKSPITPLQALCLGALDRGRNALSIYELASIVRPAGMATRAYALAVAKAMRGLEKRGYACCFRSGSDQYDQWAVLLWGLTAAGCLVAEERARANPESQGRSGEVAGGGLVLAQVASDGYEGPAGHTLRREDGSSPAGNPLAGRWVLRSPAGEIIDFDQYRADLAERNGLRLVSKVPTKSAE